MNRARGFSLLELLLALAITAILVVLLVNVVAAALNVWEAGRNQIDTFANARQILGRLGDEIIGATASPAPRQIEFSENLLVIRGTSDPINDRSENLFFVAPYPNAVPSPSPAADLCAFAYRHNNDTHTLERGFVQSNLAWKNGSSSRYQAGSYSQLEWQWRVIATGILEFEVQSFSQADLDISPTPTPPQTSPPSWSSIGTSPGMTGNTPRQIRVRIRAVDDKTLVKLSGLSPGNPAYDRLVRRSSRDFTTNIMLPSPH